MRTQHSSIRTTAMVVVALGLLAGCTPAPTGGTPTSTPSSEPSPSESGTPSPEPSGSAAPDPADPSTWVIDEGGVGPLRIGGDFAATLEELPDTWENDPANCSWMAWWTAEDSEHGIFFVRGTESDTAPIGEITVHTAAETPEAVDGPVTAEGLGVGATKDEVLSAYPDAEEGAAQIGGGSWIRLAGGEDAHVFFEFREGSDVASEVTVTIRDEPSYEVCG